MSYQVRQGLSLCNYKKGYTACDNTAPWRLLPPSAVTLPLGHVPAPEAVDDLRQPVGQLGRSGKQLVAASLLYIGGIHAMRAMTSGPPLAAELTRVDTS